MCVCGRTRCLGWAARALAPRTCCQQPGKSPGVEAETGRAPGGCAPGYLGLSCSGATVQGHGTPGPAPPRGLHFCESIPRHQVRGRGPGWLLAMRAGGRKDKREHPANKNSSKSSTQLPSDGLTHSNRPCVANQPANRLPRGCRYLGRGSAGRVFLCMSCDDRRLYAVKVGGDAQHRAQ